MCTLVKYIIFIQVPTTPISLMLLITTQYFIANIILYTYTHFKTIRDPPKTQSKPTLFVFGDKFGSDRHGFRPVPVRP